MDPKVKEAIHLAVRQEALANTLGMRLVELEEGRSVVEMTCRAEVMNNIFGRVHGGAIFALIDEAFETVCQADGTISVGLNVNVSYVSSPDAEAILQAEARLVSKSKRTATYDIKVSDRKGQLIATCHALAYRTGTPLPFLD